MPLPKEFFTPESMLTLAGAAGSTFVVCNGLQKAFSFNPRWLALVIAEVLVLAGTASTGATHPTDYLVAFVNGFLVFLTAAGGTGAAGGASGAPPAAGGPVARMPSAAAPKTAPVPPRRFLSPWF
jgi:hypothetical protein